MRFPLPPLPPCLPTERGRSLAAHLGAEGGTAISAIVLPKDYVVREGLELMHGVRVGKFLGAGMQARN